MLLGEQVTLREWRETDLPALAELRNDIALQALLMARARPNPIDRVRSWLVKRSNQTDMLFFVIARRSDDAVVGYVQVAALDLFQGTGDLGICLAPTAQGRGNAHEAMALLYAHLRTASGIRKLGLRVRADNARALAFYKREGYREIGRLERHYREGNAFIDVVLMERFLPG